MSNIMKIKILNDSRIAELEENKDIILAKMQMNNNNEWLREFFDTENPFIDSKIEIDDFELITSEEHPPATDCFNAIRLYENMKDLTESQAADKRLWIGLAFGKFYNYMQYRWPVEDINKAKNYIKRRWLFPYPGRRSLFMNGLARLWWFVHFTIDESLENPYGLTEMFFGKFEILQRIIYRNYSMSKSVRLATLKAMFNYQKDGGVITGKIRDEIYKYISFLGGAYILDAFDEKDLEEKIYKKLFKLNEEYNFTLKE